MKTLMITALMMIFATQVALADEVSNGHDGDNGSVRIIREIR